MKKRIASILIVLALMLGMVPAPAFAASINIDSAAVYHTPANDYKSGDCILTASKMMIRRAAIMRGSAAWALITNNSIRSLATTSGLLLNNFKVEVDGLAYTVSSGTFSGSNEAARIREFEQLLSEHPEGIVVHGNNAAKSGPHGVLVTAVKGGVPYAADSTHNTGAQNKGIEKWSDTTMLSVKKVSKYWYIKSVAPGTGDSLIKKLTSSSKLKIKAYNKPKTIKKGKGFNIKGKITSNKKVASVIVQITDMNGNIRYQGVAAPKKKSYNIKKLNKKLKFKKLEKGQYYYTVVASDANGSRTLVNKKFKKK